MSQVTLGGERLGAGKRQKVEMHNYERSTHDLSYAWRSTMAMGTLVPFMTEIALPGDTFDIKLAVDVLTHPTIGPLFASGKVQLDIFQAPLRLYQAMLHMNMLGIGRDMSKVMLPQVQILADVPGAQEPIDNQQINASSIFKYLGISGLGNNNDGTGAGILRQFNATAWLAYWDTVKNYYANKQEEIGAVIHQNPEPQTLTLSDPATLNFTAPDDVSIPIVAMGPPLTYQNVTFYKEVSQIVIPVAYTESLPEDMSFIRLHTKVPAGNPASTPITMIFENFILGPDNLSIIGTNPRIGKLDWPGDATNMIPISWIEYVVNPFARRPKDVAPRVVTFPLENIDTMRMNLLQAPTNVPYLIEQLTAIAPYELALQLSIDGGTDIGTYSAQFAQEGLAVKTYNSDLFNNWISTEWIDGPDGISEITAVSTAGGSFTIDALNLSSKIYNMLNRIAISGGTYDDWLDAVYTHERQRSAENPMYMGGLITNLGFQEVISNAQTVEQPLGTLAGRGRILGDHKGGNVVIRVDEPSYILGIVSITPSLDYSQGNKWDVNLKTLNDLHKPALDQIGFQDLITDQMAWWDTDCTNLGVVTTKSAGKQPAWINYMTNYNRVYGNFADQNQQMFMVFNRRYIPNWSDGSSISDLTTYIDPVKFNYIFADTRRDAMNYWMQIGVGMHVRRKISAKVIPNL